MRESAGGPPARVLAAASAPARACRSRSTTRDRRRRASGGGVVPLSVPAEHGRANCAGVGQGLGGDPLPGAGRLLGAAARALLGAGRRGLRHRRRPAPATRVRSGGRLLASPRWSAGGHRAGDPPFTELVVRVRNELLDGLDNLVPFERLVRALNPDGLHQRQSRLPDDARARAAVRWRPTPTWSHPPDGSHRRRRGQRPSSTSNWSSTSAPTATSPAG